MSKWKHTVLVFLCLTYFAKQIARRNINNLRYAADTTLMAQSEEELKSLLMKVEEESEKPGLKHSKNKDHGNQSHHFMANRWGNNKSERLYFVGVKITADGDSNHEIKRCLLLGREAMTNLDSILKSRDITLPTKVCIVKSTVFPAVMSGCESWGIKKVECQQLVLLNCGAGEDALRVPWTVRISSQSILKEISPEYLL